MKNKIAGILKVGSITLFVLAFFGAVMIAQEEKTVLAKEYTYMDDEYETTTVFNGTLFFTSILSTSISCALIYGIGELIQLQSDNNELLKNTITKKENDDTENKV